MKLTESAGNQVPLKTSINIAITPQSFTKRIIIPEEFLAGLDDTEKDLESLAANPATPAPVSED